LFKLQKKKRNKLLLARPNWALPRELRLEAEHRSPCDEPFLRCKLAKCKALSVLVSFRAQFLLVLVIFSSGT
jgi:hypothetical protein